MRRERQLGSMRNSASYGVEGLVLQLPRSGHRCLARFRRRHAGCVPLCSCVVLCLLPLSLAAQTDREAEAEANIRAAKQAQAAGDYARAVAGYQAAVKLMPEVPELSANLGIAYYLEKDYDKAIAAFLRALKRKPALEGANLYLGMSYIRISQFAASIDPLKKAIAANPQLRLAYINLGASYDELGDDEEAVQVLQRAQKVFPADPEVLYSLGSLYYRLMFKAYGKMAEVAPNSYRYDQVMGQSFEEREEYPAAMVEFQKAIKENPQAPGLHYALGNVLWLQGRWGEARQEFEAELAISPEDSQSTWKLGNSYLQERQYDKAMPYLQKAIRQKPSLGGAYQDLGKLYLETHDNEHALYYLKKVVQMDPEEATPHYLLALTYRRLGNVEESRAEMGTFEKLKKEENDRRLPPEAMFADAQRQAEKTQSSGTPNPQDPQ
jgi:tetratricopeptide (TPR) repeat protein